MLDLTSAPPGVDLWFRFPLSLFRYLSLLRNHLCRFYLQDLVEVVADDEEDDEGGEGEACQDGEDGGELFGYGTGHAAICPILQQGVEEDYEGSADKGGNADEPQVEATEEQGDVLAFGAVNLA